MKLYVFVRKDLPKSYQAVQAGHAVAQWLLDHPEQDWNNHTLIYLGVPNEAELQEAYDDFLDFSDYKVSAFYEPDIGNQMTAIAVYAKDTEFSNLPLL